VSERLVVDANPLVSALMKGRAEDILLSPKFTFFSTQHTLFEVQKYLPRVAAKLRVPESEVLQAYSLLPVVAYQPAVYDSYLARARNLLELRDPKDVQILALVMHLGYPLWSDDRDFEGVPGISVVKTSELLARI
jgi:predicted nucleic acid-binding protein